MEGAACVPTLGEILQLRPGSKERGSRVIRSLCSEATVRTLGAHVQGGRGSASTEIPQLLAEPWDQTVAQNG